jgi:hypothetical protein
VTKIYLLPYAKDIVYINYGGKKDAKGNYIYKHVLYDEEEITLSKYLDITELKNKN